MSKGLYETIERAKKVLKIGDRIRATRGCNPRPHIFIFDGWDGNWIVSKSGINDIYAGHITHVNGIIVNFNT